MTPAHTLAKAEGGAPANMRVMSRCHYRWLTAVVPDWVSLEALRPAHHPSQGRGLAPANMRVMSRCHYPLALQRVVPDWGSLEA